jgi:flagellar hook-basal body complex protein FliE
MDDLKIGNLKPVNIKNDTNVKPAKQAEFGKAIKDAMNRVSRLENEADISIIDLLKGKADIHETMIALQKADISMRLLLTIRNKAIESYKEIMHMQF